MLATISIPNNTIFSASQCNRFSITRCQNPSLRQSISKKENCVKHIRTTSEAATAHSYKYNFPIFRPAFPPNEGPKYAIKKPAISIVIQSMLHKRDMKYKPFLRQYCTMTPNSILNKIPSIIVNSLHIRTQVRKSSFGNMCNIRKSEGKKLLYNTVDFKLFEGKNRNKCPFKARKSYANSTQTKSPTNKLHVSEVSQWESEEDENSFTNSKLNIC